LTIRRAPRSEKTSQIAEYRGPQQRRGEECRLACRPADNPFASHRIEGLAFRCAALQWSSLMQRMDDLGGRVAIVGPKGSGKTTLLKELARRLDEPVVIVRIPGDCPDPWRTTRSQLPRRSTHQHAILVDGSEQLGVFGWRRLLHATRSARRLIVTLHRRGHLPTLLDCNTDSGLLRDLVSELAPQGFNEIEPSLDGLFHRHNGNLRLCLRELYDVYAARA
jgi:hypothetical protein